MSLPGKYNFKIQRGADFTRDFVKKIKSTGVAVDMTGLKARAQFRTLLGEDGITTTTTLLLGLANNAGVSVLAPATSGVTRLRLTNAQTVLLCLTNKDTKVAYGIEHYDDSVTPELVTPFLQGHITIESEIVR